MMTPVVATLTPTLPPPIRIAVIGAGPSGIAAMRAWRYSIDKGDVNAADIHLVCFEKQANIGGAWNYMDATTVDEYGEAIHSAMYRNLVLNGQKEFNEYFDYTWMDHFAFPIPSYPPRAVLLDYMQGYCQKFNILPWCRFRTPVRKVQYNKDKAHFDVLVHDLVKDNTYTEPFDYVVVANGHYSTPNMPRFKGWETFPGVRMHAKEFRDAHHCRDLHVLCVGGSISAEDIALQCWKCGSASVTISYRTEAIDYEWPDGIDERPLLTRIDGRNVAFSDGSVKEFDVIILCTGYRHHFPFLPDDELRLKTTYDRYWVKNLYKGVMWHNNPRLFYIGMQKQNQTTFLFDAQAWYIRDVMLRRIPLPSSRAEMKAYEKQMLDAEAIAIEEELEEKFQDEYMKELMEESAYPAVLDFKAMDEAGDDWTNFRDEDIVTYRDQPTASFITGTLASKCPVSWKDLKDDSSESYLALCTRPMLERKIE